MAASFSFYPITAATSGGQIEIAVLALWTASILAYEEGLVVFSAIALALATGLKITPIFAVPLFILWKDRRWLLTYAASVAALFAAMLAFNGAPTMAACFHYLRAMSASLPSLDNKCISAFVSLLGLGFTHRGLSDATRSVASAPLQFVARLTSFVFYAACLFLAWRNRRHAQSSARTQLFAIFILVAALTSPQTWRYGYAAALIPFALLWSGALERPVTRTRIALLVIASVAVATVVIDWTAGLRLPFLLSFTLAEIWTVSCVLLCLQVLANPQPSDPEPST